MEQHQHRQKRQQTTKQAQTPILSQAQLDAAQREPMGTIRGWMTDFGLLGASTGLAMALTHIALHTLPEGASLTSLLTVAPALIGCAGAFAGAAAGWILRVSRGKMPALMGVLAASCGANAVGSTLTVGAHGLFPSTVEIIQGQATPLSLAVLCLIPVAAVLRWRGQNTLPWMLLFGLVAGALIGL